jgi:hypothetical protein
LVLALVESTSVHFDSLRGGRASELGPLLVNRLAADWVWMPVAALVFRTTGRTLATGGGGRRLAIRLAALGLGLAPFYMLMDAFTHPLLRGGGGAAVLARLRLVPASTLLWDAFLYSALALASFALLLHRRSVDQARESSALRVRLERAELELLRAQLEPHFLFNALNSIAGLVRGARAEEATRALARLSELLRYVLEASRQERVPVAWEVQFVESYLELQQARFGERMQFHIHQDAGVRGHEVPPLLLQPLIENAVVHGVAGSREPARIDVRIGAADGQLRLDVESTRDPGALEAEARGGVGLRNTRERLERIYGGDFRFEAGPDGDQRYRVHISLPWAVS